MGKPYHGLPLSIIVSISVTTRISKGDSCSYFHLSWPPVPRRATSRRLRRSRVVAKSGGKGGGKTGKPKAKAKRRKAKVQCACSSKNGSCQKGANCNKVHPLATSGGNQLALPSNTGTAPSGAFLSNPFAAFSIQIQRGRPDGRSCRQRQGR